MTGARVRSWLLTGELVRVKEGYCNSYVVVVYAVKRDRWRDGCRGRSKSSDGSETLLCE